MRTWSTRLQQYLDSVRAESGRDIVIEEVAQVGMPGMLAAFRLDHKVIRIQIVAPWPGPTEDLEETIAHEATHGLLVYGRGYSTLVPTSLPSSEHEDMAVSILMTMLDDIVVNKLIADSGFSPYADVYLQMVKQETDAARLRDLAFYDSVSANARVRRRFRVNRCVSARALLRYYKLDAVASRRLAAFVKFFGRAYPSETQEADRILAVLDANDIFTPEGHRRALAEVLKLWGLGDVARVSSS